MESLDWFVLLRRNGRRGSLFPPSRDLDNVQDLRAMGFADIYSSFRYEKNAQKSQSGRLVKGNDGTSGLHGKTHLPT